MSFKYSVSKKGFSQTHNMSETCHKIRDMEIGEVIIIKKIKDTNSREEVPL